MSILVHAARATRHWLPAGVRKGERMYHVLSDRPDSDGTLELVCYVTRFGLRPEWIQYPGSYREHFDAREETGIRMLRDGAIPATNHDVAMLLRARRVSRESSSPDR